MFSKSNSTRGGFRRAICAAAATISILGTTMAPSVAYAKGAIREVRQHGGNTIFGYGVLYIEFFYCDGDYDRFDFYPGQETYTSVETFECT